MNMPSGPIIILVLTAIVMLAYDWRRLRDARTVMAYSILYIGGYTIAVLLVFNPDLPGPNDVLRPLFSPLAKLLLGP